MTTVLADSKKLTQLETINWPVYKLGENEPQIKEGVIFYLSEILDNEDNLISVYKLVDDKNIDKSTIGLRRLQLPQDKLFKISTAIYMLQDLIKLAKPTSWFIDTAGKVFQYKKSTRAKLKTHTIKQVLPVNGIGCVLEIEGLSERFKSLSIPNNQPYAVMLYYNGKVLLYGLSATKVDSSWRLV